MADCETSMCSSTTAPAMPAERRVSWCAHLPPYGVGVAPTTANGLPTRAPVPYGRESQSIALLRTAGIVPLYSGVTTSTRSAAATAARSAAAAAGTSAPSRSSL